MDTLMIILLFSLELATPFLLGIGIIWGFFAWRRARREKQSLESSKGNADMSAMEHLRRKARMMKLLAVVLWPLLTIGFLCAGAGLLFSCMLASVVSSGCSFHALRVRKKYNALFKEQLVASELSKVFHNITYEPSRTFDVREIASLGFFAPPDAWQGNDYIEAEYRGVRFRQSDLTLQKVILREEEIGGTTNERETRENIFRGIGMAFDFSDEFKGEVQVVGRDFAGRRVARDGWQRVETELAVFNDTYQVYAPDPVAAMTTLAPRMIEGITLLRDAVDAPLALCFKGKTMFAFFAVDRETFDVSENKTLLEERRLLEKDIAFVTSFLDTMYFKRQEGDFPEELGRRERLAASSNAPVHPQTRTTERDRIRQHVHSAKRGLVFLSANLGRFLFAAYVVSAAYAFIKLPEELFLSTDVTAKGVISAPTLAYLVIIAVFLTPLLRQRGGWRAFAYGSVLLLIHTLFINANMALL